jgi:ribosomal protein S18 acetylase RimI-like enzyme
MNPKDGGMTAQEILMDEAISEDAVKRAVQLHISEIPKGFLTGLGERFLFLVYKTIVAHEESFLIGAFDDQKLVGFICGSTDTAGLYRDFALAHGFRVAGLLVPAIFSPRVVRGILETVIYPKRSIPNIPRAAILNFAVHPAARGKGVGGRLLNALGREFRRRGENMIRIVCGSDQMAAQRLYLRNGATEICSLELHRGVKSLVMIWDTGLAKETPEASAKNAGDQHKLHTQEQA